MTAVVCAAFDAAADEAVLAVRDRLISHGLRLQARPAHRPHVTLAATRVPPAQLPVVIEVIQAIADDHAPLPLLLSRIGRFDHAGALWLGPAEAGGSTGLRTLQRSVDATLERVGGNRAFGQRSASASWVAHCTLATRLTSAQLRDMQAVLESGFQPIDAVVSGLAVILVGGSGDVALMPL